MVHFPYEVYRAKKYIIEVNEIVWGVCERVNYRNGVLLSTNMKPEHPLYNSYVLKR